MSDEDSSDYGDEAEKLVTVHKCDKLEVTYFEDTLAMVNQWYFADTLGEGQFGKVYLLEDGFQQTKVAVKVVKKSHLPEIENEIRALKAIKSDGVVKFIDKLWSPTYSDVFLVLEYVDGRPVGEVSGEGSLLTEVIPLKELRTVARKMCEAVAAVHSVGVLHLDIKPEHFIRSRDTIKLIDFGSALTLSDQKGKGKGKNSAADTTTVDDSFNKTVGTPLFLAPEAMTGKLACPAASLDLWALGVSIYAIGVGYVPFGRGLTTEAALYAKVPDEPLEFPFDLKVPSVKSVSPASSVASLSSFADRRAGPRPMGLPRGPSRPAGLAMVTGVSAMLLLSGSDGSASVGGAEDTEEDDVETDETEMKMQFMSFLTRVLCKTMTLRPTLPDMLEDPYCAPNIQDEEANLSLSFRAHDTKLGGGSAINRRRSTMGNETRLKKLLMNPSLIAHGEIEGMYTSMEASNPPTLPNAAKPRRLSSADFKKAADGHRHSRTSSGGSSPAEENARTNTRKTFIYNTSLVQLPSSGKHVQRVLLCEFQFHIRNTIEKIIRTTVVPGEVRVDVCRTGAEAVAMATRCKYRLIILSTRLVDKPGLQTAYEIREFERSNFTGTVPILGLGSAGMNVLEAGLRSGCWQAVVAHPIAIREFECMLKWRGLKTREVNDVIEDLHKQTTKNKGNNKYFSDYVDTVVRRAKQMGASCSDVFGESGTRRGVPLGQSYANLLAPSPVM